MESNDPTPKKAAKQPSHKDSDEDDTVCAECNFPTKWPNAKRKA